MASEDTFKATRRVLELIGLVPDEIQTFFNMTGRDLMMAGEIAVIVGIPEARAEEIAKKLVSKGLAREIPGKITYYTALPPYVALLSQIRQFKDSIRNVQASTPQNLQIKFQSMEQSSQKLQKFEEYRNYVREMKTKLPAQLRNDFQKFEKELEQVKKFHDVKKFILELRQLAPNEISKEFEKMESLIENVKTEISSAFETQFRVGAMKTMAEKIVGKVVSTHFLNMTEYFKDKFIKTTQNMLDQVISQLGMLSDTAGDISSDLGTTFESVEAGLESTLEDLEKRITGVHQDVVAGIEELKTTFQREIFQTLQDDIILNIIKQFELAEQTMNEFWERSKLTHQQSYKDVWFIRSPEGMKAQINDSISRAKMRLHIIAPKIEHIDIIALSKLRSNVNIRISTNYNSINVMDQEKLSQIERYPNISIRNYQRENIWAINKDFEEVIVCVVSKSESGGIEIAGMGSVLDEHIKLFAGVLEDVWIQSKKLSSLGLYAR